MTALEVLHCACGVIVMAEALNKLERVSPCKTGLSAHARLVDGLKALAWGLLALGAGGAIASPFMGMEQPTLRDVCVLGGFAVLIVRTRVKEG
jgi:hypothetical protein